MSYLLTQALALLEEATSYTSCETWSPSLTDEINSFVVNARAAQAATPAPADDLSSLRNRLRVAEESLERCRAVCNATAEQWRADVAATPAPGPLPLTDEQIDIICERERMKWSARKGPPTYEFACAFARAIERAHGIGQGKEASNG